MRYIFANNVVQQLTIDVVANDIYLTVDNGATFPIPVVGEEAFYATLQSPGGGVVEIVLVTARNGDVLTVQRGADSTGPRPWLVGDTISMRTTSANLKDFYDANYPVTGGNLQGRMFLALDPTVQNEAATKNYVDLRTAGVFATHSEIDSFTPPVDKAVSADGLRSITAGQLNTLATATKTGLIPAINELKSLVSGGLSGSVFWGVFDASAGIITWNPGSGQSGNTLPAPAPNNAGRYLIASLGGDVPPGGAPAGTYYPGDWLISDGGSVWYHLVTGTTGTINASSVIVSPTVAGQDNVQSALQVIQTNSVNYLQVTGGAMTAGGNILFTVSAAKTTRLDGVDPKLSAIERFVIAAGTY
jgi:hypothetical protein